MAAVLLRFTVSNHRSIMQPVELSMIAVDEDRQAAREYAGLSEKVLTVAGIYGPNASGKSNILDALTWIADAIGRSLRSWDEIVPRDPFRFGNGPESPSRFEVETMTGDVRHQYVLEVNSSEVLTEGLYSFPERRRRTLFERDGMEISFRRGLGSQSATRELLTPTTLALSAAMRFDDREIAPFGREVSRLGTIGSRRARRGPRTWDSARSSTNAIFAGEGDGGQLSLFPEILDWRSHVQRSAALALLQFADLGIDDVQMSEEAGANSVATLIAANRGEPPRRRLQFMHTVSGQQLPFDITDESDGTQTWFRLIGPTLRALEAGELLLLDEIDASLHPRLSARLLELFQDPETNPGRAQLIFTSHDTSLLGYLNRDEVWLTEKDSNGATDLTALAEYGGDKVRRSLNLERAYLQGRFGAVPELDQSLLRRALGVSTEGSD